MLMNPQGCCCLYTRMSERATRDVLHSFQNTRRLRSGAHRVDLVDYQRGARGTTAGLPQLYLPGTYRDEGRRGASQGPSEVGPDSPAKPGSCSLLTPSRTSWLSQSIRTPTRPESDTRQNWMINAAGSSRLLPGPQPFSFKQEARSS
jgi:hypothetical protein